MVCRIKVIRSKREESKLIVTVKVEKGILILGHSLYDLEYCCEEEIGELTHIFEVGGQKCILTISIYEKNLSSSCQLDVDQIMYLGQKSQELSSLPLEQKKSIYYNSLDLFTADEELLDFSKKYLNDCYHFVYGGNTSLISKVGGYVKATSGFEYPRDDNGKTMVLLGQITINECPNFDFSAYPFLKSNDILYIFVGLNEEYYFKYSKIIILNSSKENLIEIIPNDIDDDFGIFKEEVISLVPGVSLPSHEHKYFSSLEWNDDCVEAYQTILASISFYNKESDVQFLGYPSYEQNCILAEAFEEFYKNDLETIERVQDSDDWIEAISPLQTLLSFHVMDRFSELFNDSDGLDVNSDIEGKFNIVVNKDLLMGDNLNNATLIYQI